MGNDCRGVALLRLKPKFRNKMAINKITNYFIVFFAILSRGIGMRRSTLRLYSRKVGFMDKIVHIL